MRGFAGKSTLVTEPCRQVEQSLRGAQRRSNPLFRLALLDCFASLAMTTLVRTKRKARQERVQKIVSRSAAWRSTRADRHLLDRPVLQAPARASPACPRPRSAARVRRARRMTRPVSVRRGSGAPGARDRRDQRARRRVHRLGEALGAGKPRSGVAVVAHAEHDEIGGQRQRARCARSPRRVPARRAAGNRRAARIARARRDRAAASRAPAARSSADCRRARAARRRASPRRATNRSAASTAPRNSAAASCRRRRRAAPRRARRSLR